MTYVALLFTVCYLIFGSLLIYYWQKIKPFIPSKKFPFNTKISIIIAVRNEEKHILHLLKDLNCQDYPCHLLEVIIVDDHSDDNTPEVVNNFISHFKLKTIRLTASLSSKKNAISAGVKEAESDLIIVTDGDCRVGTKWISTIQQFYREKKAVLVCGGVTFNNEKTLFEKMQTIEFASLTASGAACLQAGYPNMCNGANLAYEKKVFEEVGGFEGNEHISSGDDEFLMHKVYDKYPERVHFLKNVNATVFTEAKHDLNSFFNQRKRWAGKWKYYQFNSIRFIAIFIFLVNFSLITQFTLSIMQQYSFTLLTFNFIAKITIDFILISGALKYYGKKMNILIYLFTAFLYPLYVSFFGIISNKGKYTWKGRRLS